MGIEFKKTFKITVNGKEYPGLAEVPEEFRHMVESGMAAARAEAAKDPVAGALLKAAGEEAGPAAAAPVVLTPVKKNSYFTVDFSVDMERRPENGNGAAASPSGPAPLRPASSLWPFVILACAAAMAVLWFLKK